MDENQNTQNEQVLSNRTEQTENVSQETGSGNFGYDDIFGNVETEAETEQDEKQADGENTQGQEPNDEPTTSTETQNNTGKPFYTPEEMKALDWQAVDTSRIPPEQMAFYKSMQASFTKKRQAQAEELRKLAGTGGSGQYHQEGINFDANLQAFKEAQGIVKAKMPDADEYDPVYPVAVQTVTNDILTRERSKRESANRFQAQLTDAVQKYGVDFAAVDNMAQQIMDNEYPSSVARDVLSAAHSGNFAPMKAVLEEAHRRISPEKNTSTQTVETKPHVANQRKIEPPKTIGAGVKVKSTGDATKDVFGF